MKKLLTITSLAICVGVLSCSDSKQPSVKSESVNIDKGVAKNVKSEPLSQQTKAELVRSRYFEKNKMLKEETESFSLDQSQAKFSMEKLNPETQQHWEQDYPGIKKHPVWKREHLVSIRKEYKSLISKGQKEIQVSGESARAKSRKALKKWYTANKSELKRIKNEETLLLNLRTEDLQFSEEEIEQVKTKFYSETPVFSIEDYTVIAVALNDKKKKERWLKDHPDVLNIFKTMSKYYQSR